MKKFMDTINQLGATPYLLEIVVSLFIGTVAFVCQAVFFVGFVVGMMMGC